MDAALLSGQIQQFIDASQMGAVIEGGEVIFNLTDCRYSISNEQGRCVVHFWSSERNCVRRVLDAEHKNGSLRLQVQRLGRPKPTHLEICRDRDQRSPTEKRVQRAAYERQLERGLLRHFPGYKPGRVKSSVDLPHSFGPVHARGTLHKGQTMFAIVGVNADERQAYVNGALTIGLLWLDYLREREAGHRHVAGLKIFVPPGQSGGVRTRLAHLNRNAASIELYEFDERQQHADIIDSSDSGDIASRLVHLPNPQGAAERFSSVRARLHAAVPESEAVAMSATEMSFRLHGLEFARARFALPVGGTAEIVIGVGPYESVLDDSTEPLFAENVRRLRQARQPGRARPSDTLWRKAPERWLESLIVGDVSNLDYRLDRRFAYSQVPAFDSIDRAMIDVLTATKDGRLAVLQLKADEDLHLPLQALDYWARVRLHQERGEFQKFGYFDGVTLSEKPPLLILVAPSLRIHPTTDSLLRYLSPEIEWELIAVNENWREGVKTIFRKRASNRA